MLVVSDAKIADLLLNKPEGVHVDVLAEQSGLDAGKLGRILRLLATKHCFKEGISHRGPNHCLSALTFMLHFLPSQAKRIREQSFEHEALVYGPSLRLGWPCVTPIALLYNHGSDSCLRQ